jgi:hypothetical protein
MKECFNKILSEVDSMIDEIDLFGYDIIETSLYDISATKYFNQFKN